MSVNFKKGGVLFSPINHWDLDDGNIVLIYQGSRGENPDLDFIIKLSKFFIKKVSRK